MGKDDIEKLKMIKLVLMKQILLMKNEPKNQIKNIFLKLPQLHLLIK